MKQYLNPKNLPSLILGLGGLALGLRGLLYSLGVDEKGLLTRWNFFEILLWLVTFAAAALVIGLVLPLKGSNRYADNWSASIPGAVGSFLAAAGIGITAITGFEEISGILPLIRTVLGLLSVPALILAGLARLKGTRPVFICHTAVCLFFAIDMVLQYRQWSGHPQLQDYIFHLGACITLMLTAYYRASFDVGFGRRRMQLATGLLAAFFCIVCLSGDSHRILYLTCGTWCITNLCPFTPVPRRRRPRPEEPAPAADPE